MSGMPRDGDKVHDIDREEGERYLWSLSPARLISTTMFITTASAAAAVAAAAVVVVVVVVVTTITTTMLVVSFVIAALSGFLDPVTRLVGTTDETSIDIDSEHIKRRRGR